MMETKLNPSDKPDPGDLKPAGKTPEHDIAKNEEKPLLVSPKLKSYLEHLLKLALKHHRTDMGAIDVLRPKSELLEIILHYGLKSCPHKALGGNNVFDNTPFGRAIRTKKAVVINELKSEKDLRSNSTYPFCSVLVTPICNNKGKPLGTLSTYFQHPHNFSQHDLLKADEIAGMIGNVITRYPIG